MKSLLEIGDDYRLVPTGTVIFDAGHTVIRVLEDTVIAQLFMKEQGEGPTKTELGHVLGGKIEIIVDAIIHTREGAAGKSVEKIVDNVALRTVDKLPFEELAKAPAKRVEEAFPSMEATVSRIFDDISVKKMSIEVNDWKSSKKGCILYAPTGDAKKSFILVIEGEKRVIIDEPAVYVVSKRKYVAVNEDGVHITGRSGKNVVINSSFPGKIIDRIFSGIRSGFNFNFDFDRDYNCDFDFDFD